MKKIRLALLTSTALIVGAALVQHSHAPLIREAQAQMAEFGGDRLIPLGFCSYSPTTATTNILNGSIGCANGVFGTIGAGVTGTGLSVIPALAKYAQICVTAAAFWRDDGILAAAGATGSGGMPMGSNSASNCQFYAGNLSNFSIIQASGTVSVLLYGQP